MKKLICMVLCALVLLALVACQSSGETTAAGTDSLMRPLVPGTEWGMTADEVKSALSKAGVEVTVNESTGSYWIDISAEEAAKLGLETVAGMEYNVNSPTPITLTFLTDKDGVVRLTSVLVDVAVPTEEFHLSLTASQDVMNAVLTKVYGEPAGEMARWGTTGKKITAEEATNLTGEELALLESNDYDAFYVYPMLHYIIEGVHNLEATLMYDASHYVHLLYGNYQ